MRYLVFILLGLCACTPKSLNNINKNNSQTDKIVPQITVNYEGFGLPPSIEIKVPENVVARYTLDGSLPSAKSLIAPNSIDIIENVELKVQAFKNDKPIGDVVTKKVAIVDKFAKLNLFTEPAPPYEANGPYSLADRLRGDENDLLNYWVGFQGSNCIINIDLGKKQDVSKIKIGYLNKPESLVFPPTYISVVSTNNNEHYSTECEWGTTSPTPADNKPYLSEAQIKCSFSNCRWLRIKIENLGICPDWHERKGEKAWLFIDEIWVE